MLYFQHREWTKEEIEVALEERSNQSKKITFLTRDKEILETKYKKLVEQNERLQIILDSVISVAKGDAH